MFTLASFVFLSRNSITGHAFCRVTSSQMDFHWRWKGNEVVWMWSSMDFYWHIFARWSCFHYDPMKLPYSWIISSFCLAQSAALAGCSSLRFQAVVLTNLAYCGSFPLETVRINSLNPSACNMYAILLSSVPEILWHIEKRLCWYFYTYQQGEYFPKPG